MSMFKIIFVLFLFTLNFCLLIKTLLFVGKYVHNFLKYFFYYLYIISFLNEFILSSILN